MEPLLIAERFCSPACARARVLEILEVIDSAGAPATISDLTTVYEDLALLFVSADAAVAEASRSARSGF